MGQSVVQPLALSRPSAQDNGVRDRWRGQALAEFALLVPLFFVMLIGLVEFAFALNASLNTNYASRAAGLIAAQAGNASAADCLILQAIEQAMNPPVDQRRITSVEIQRTNPSGSTVYARSRYTRSGSTTCSLQAGGTMNVPYSATGTGYPPGQRCNVLPPNGCPTLLPARTTVDTIAVQITYTYAWQTPLKSLISIFNGSIAGTGMVMVERNAFRMEPVL